MNPNPPQMQQQMGGMFDVNPIDAVLMSINTNPYFIGVMMLLLNFGGRFLSLEMTKGQEAFFYNTWVRRALIFIVIFVGTRNVLVAFIMSFIIILCIGYLFNENSSLCIFKAGLPGSKCNDKEEFVGMPPNVSLPPPGPQGPPPGAQIQGPQQVGGLTKEESMILASLQNKLNNYQPREYSDNSSKKDNVNPSAVSQYFQKINMLQGSKN